MWGLCVLVDYETAGFAVGRSARTIRAAVADGRLERRGSYRPAKVELEQCIEVFGDPLAVAQIFLP